MHPLLLIPTRLTWPAGGRSKIAPESGLDGDELDHNCFTRERRLYEGRSFGALRC